MNFRAFQGMTLVQDSLEIPFPELYRSHLSHSPVTFPRLDLKPEQRVEPALSPGGTGQACSTPAGSANCCKNSELELSLMQLQAPEEFFLILFSHIKF